MLEVKAILHLKGPWPYTIHISITYLLCPLILIADTLPRDIGDAAVLKHWRCWVPLTDDIVLTVQHKQASRLKHSRLLG